MQTWHGGCKAGLNKGFFMFKSLLAGASLAALMIFPAHATLQIAAQIGPDSFFCADNTACDTNPAVGTIQLNDQIVDGIQVEGSIQVSDHGAFPSLNTSSLDLINTLGSTVTATIAVSDNNFPAVAAAFTTAGSGVWQGPGASTISMGWFIDAANAQGANTAFDTPGVQVDAFANSSIGRTSAFSHNGNLIMVLGAPFSMSEQATISLAAGEALINRGQAMVTSDVPETSTWMMVGLGFTGLAALGRKKRPGRWAI